MRVVFVRKTRIDTFGSILFWEGNNPIAWMTFQTMPKTYQKKWDVNHTTPLNFEKFLKVEFNLEFNETIAIGFIMYSISYK